MWPCKMNVVCVCVTLKVIAKLCTNQMPLTSRAHFNLMEL